MDTIEFKSTIELEAMAAYIRKHLPSKIAAQEAVEKVERARVAWLRAAQLGIFRDCVDPHFE